MQGVRTRCHSSWGHVRPQPEEGRRHARGAAWGGSLGRGQHDCRVLFRLNQHRGPAARRVTANASSPQLRPWTVHCIARVTAIFRARLARGDPSVNADQCALPPRARAPTGLSRAPQATCGAAPASVPQAVRQAICGSVHLRPCPAPITRALPIHSGSLNQVWPSPRVRHSERTHSLGSGTRLHCGTSRACRAEPVLSGGPRVLSPLPCDGAEKGMLFAEASTLTPSARDRQKTKGFQRRCDACCCKLCTPRRVARW